MRFISLALVPSLPFIPAAAQSPAQTQRQPTPAANPGESTSPPPPQGAIIFSREAGATPETQPAAQPTPAGPFSSAAAASANPASPTQPDSLAVTDAERTALTFTAYDLDVHLAPASAGISVRALLTVRNDSAAPLHRLILQLSSSLHWDAISSAGQSAVSTGALAPLAFVSHLVDTDADHTGSMSEAVVTLPQPLAPGASLTLTTLYSGTIPRSAKRLERIGAPAADAVAADWDSIAPANPDPSSHPGVTPTGTALRGFGNVLWYPVSEPPVFLGDGAKLFQQVGRTRFRESSAIVRLRLAVEYLGDPPVAAFFCGRSEQLKAISDNPNLPEAESPGIATAVFAPHPLGFRTPSLFIAGNAPSYTGPNADPDLIAAVTSNYDALPAYAAAAAEVEPLLADWFGPQPLNTLTILDHPGEPFEDDALLVRPMHAVDPATLAPSLAHSLTHVWIHSGRPWIDEGLAEFASLLWTERTEGRAAAISALDEASRALALAEPETPISSPESSSSSDDPASQPASDDATSATAAVPSTSLAGASLADATGEVFYRTKAAAVWWMLRGILGDDVLKQALKAYRLDPKLDRDPAGLQHTLGTVSHRDLSWFFNDWVYRDRGLPDLAIENVTSSQIDPASGLPAGWLVAVVVHNDGYAEAEVPVTVRSGSASQTQRLRIPGRSTASIRIVFAGTPDQVKVNDGSVPETEASIHTRMLVLPGS